MPTPDAVWDATSSPEALPTENRAPDHTLSPVLLSIV
jgi:hypothetical protein